MSALKKLILEGQITQPKDVLVNDESTSMVVDQDDNIL
jgi:hypothetical protein